jgi:hypothetical protein
VDWRRFHACHCEPTLRGACRVVRCVLFSAVFVAAGSTECDMRLPGRRSYPAPAPGIMPVTVPAAPEIGSPGRLCLAAEEPQRTSLYGPGGSLSLTRGLTGRECAVCPGPDGVGVLPQPTNRQHGRQSNVRRCESGRYDMTWRWRNSRLCASMPAWRTYGTALLPEPTRARIPTSNQLPRTIQGRRK